MEIAQSRVMKALKSFLFLLHPPPTPVIWQGVLNFFSSSAKIAILMAVI